jgi:hypothetical protein
VSPWQRIPWASRTTPARVFYAGDVVNDGYASSEITLAEHSLAENDEKHRRADRRACITSGKGFGPYLKAHKKLAAESGQRYQWKEGFGRQRPCPAIRGERGFANP